MQYKKTMIPKSGSRRFLSLFFGAWCLLLIGISCEKDHITGEDPGTPGKPLQLTHGKPIGEITVAQIGKDGGTLLSKDGTIKIEVPAGAVDASTTFSVQEVENVLKSKSKSFRLLPENVDFKKPVTITYYYGNISLGETNPDLLFLAYQDKEGYFYSANKTRGNRQSQTLSVQTTHFSDWTFYAQVDLYLSGNKLLNGELNLVEGEEVVIELKATNQDNFDRFDEEYSQIKLSGLLNYEILQKASWDYAPKKGSMKINAGVASITYKAPATVKSIERVFINVTLNGNLGKDNLGKIVQQMQIRQPVVIHPDSYFVLSESGSEMPAYNFAGEYVPGVGAQFVAMFDNGYTIGCYVNGGTGGFPYNQHGVPGAAFINLTQNGKDGMIVFRPKTCDESNTELFFSPGAFNLKSVAHKTGEYFEGEFSVTLFGYGYCEKARSKSLSGKFRIKKTN